MKIKDISEYRNPIGVIPDTYEKLPKCLIKFIDIGTTIKVEKERKIYNDGRLYCFYEGHIIIKHYKDYIYVDVNEYNIYIYNSDKKRSDNYKKKPYKRVLSLIINEN